MRLSLIQKKYDQADYDELETEVQTLKLIKFFSVQWF